MNKLFAWCIAFIIIPFGPLIPQVFMVTYVPSEPTSTPAPPTKKYISPINNYRITDRLGMREIMGIPNLHTGTDMSADVPKQNVPIRAIADGIVVRVAHYDWQYGKYITVQHETSLSKYAHLRSIHVQLWDKVKQGQTIGIMGNTGISFGTHLHFQHIEEEPWK